MELELLFDLMRRKGFHHFDGNTNNFDKNIYLSFSTRPHEQGDCVEIHIDSKDNNYLSLTGEVNLIKDEISFDNMYKVIESKYEDKNQINN